MKFIKKKKGERYWLFEYIMCSTQPVPALLVNYIRWPLAMTGWKRRKKKRLQELTFKKKKKKSGENRRAIIKMFYFSCFVFSVLCVSMIAQWNFCSAMKTQNKFNSCHLSYNVNWWANWIMRWFVIRFQTLQVAATFNEHLVGL